MAAICWYVIIDMIFECIMLSDSIMSSFAGCHLVESDYKTGDFGGDCGGNFLTGAGGFLQGLWAGWAGMRLRENSLDFREWRMATDIEATLLRLFFVCIFCFPDHLLFKCSSSRLARIKERY